MNIGDRIRFIREQKGLTLEELGKLCKTTKQTVYKYENSIVTNIPLDRLALIANALDVSQAYLMGWEEETPKNVLPMPAMERVPRVGRIACGEPITAEENIEDYDEAPQDWHADFTLLCVGDSMSPKIEDGDLVAIRKQSEVINGQIAAVRIGDEATLKQVFLHNDYIELRPINPAYASIIRRCDEMEEMRIEGKAVGLIRRIE